MQLDPKDYDVVELLEKLKKAEVGYPSELFASRRQGYLRRVSEIGLGFGVASGLKNSIKTGSSGGATTIIGGMFEALLVVAIVAEASAAAYIYRDQIADFVHSFSPNTEKSEVLPPPENASPAAEFITTEIMEATEPLAPSLTVTPTTMLTAVPTIVAETDQTEEQAVSTPNPNGNNGNHYGQTPKPERTKDNGGGQDDGKGKDKDR